MDLPEFELDTSVLEDAAVPAEDRTYDLLIVGGGPAAMSAAIYAARKMLSLAVVTKDFGGQMLETSDVENWLGFQSISGRELAGMFGEHVKSFDISVRMNTAVREVQKEGGLFSVITADGRSYRGHAVVVATGKRHRSLNVPGEKELVGKGVAYCATCDAPLFKEKRVVVAGGGNSAFTTAADLLKVGAQVILVNFLKGWQADGSLYERVSRYPGVDFLENTEVVRIEGADRVEAVVVKGRDDGDEKRIDAAGLFVEIGLLPNSDSVKDLVRLNDAGEIIVDCACRTSVKGLFGAGDVTTVPHKQIVISAGEGAKAALSAYEYLMDERLI
ncbi:MAG: FAD-dependent oxidoreductase [Deltaproteobacteria bacterium]|nr:FAD-dependent oxidoreductase [Deltaproteobacteria bacterium]